MSDLGIREAMDLAWQHHRAGRVADALEIYRRVLAAAPDHVDALHLLGILLTHAGQGDEGVALLQRAAELRPDAAELQLNLARGMRLIGHHSAALGALHRAVQIEPGNAAAQEALSTQLCMLDRLHEAVAAAEHAVALDPQSASAQLILGTSLARQERYRQAITHFRRALSIRPGYLEALNNLGSALRAVGQIGEAVHAYESALQLNKDFVEARKNLAAALRDAGRPADAVAELQRVTAEHPGFADAFYQLGLAFRECQRVDDSIAAFSRAIELEPTHFAALAAKGGAMMSIAQLDGARQLLHRSLELHEDPHTHGSLCLLSNYDPALSGEDVRQIHAGWAVRHAPRAAERIYRNTPDPERRLKVGYVSPDFRAHAVTHFIDPLLRGHNREAVEVFCYADVARPDEVTLEQKAQADRWRDIRGLNDDEALQQIHQDSIDVLIDLAGHTTDNRLRMFSRRPAPVQISMIGYPCTTGVPGIEARITDELCDPPGAECFYTERLMRVPGTLWCYQAMNTDATVRPLPADGRGGLTFGSVNNFSKINRSVLDAWMRILAGVPGSQLRIQSAGLESRQARDAVLAAARAGGIDPARISTAGWSSFRDYLNTIANLDIALDTFPYTGGTTTCHQLYQGVPTVSLAGNRQVSRMGVSMLHAVGLDQLIAATTDEYVQKAIDLAADRDELRRLRAGLRETMLASPLCNRTRYIHLLEGIYRQLWREWCQRCS